MRLTKEYEVAALYVTENGSAWHDEPDANGYVADHERAAYLLDHVDAMANAAAQGAPMRGYFAWSLMDNFEWSHGYWPRFGLAYVDYQTQARTLKLSGGTYRQLVAEHRQAPGHHGGASPRGGAGCSGRSVRGRLPADTA
jgi:beta-glucosidase